MSQRAIQLSIVLPCYNEADNLPMLLQRYRGVWEDLPAELVLVNNGSTDATTQVLERELRRPELTFARTVDVYPNQGYGHGLYAGLQAANGESIGFSHADMQCDPKDLFTAYHALTRQKDPTRVLVKGKRAKRGFGASLLTASMSILASTVLLMRLTDINAQPKVFHRSHLARLGDPPDGFEFDVYVLCKARRAGLTIMTVPVLFGERAHGESKWASTLRSRYRTIMSTIAFILRLRFTGSK